MEERDGVLNGAAGAPCAECRGTGVKRVPVGFAAVMRAQEASVEPAREVPCPACGGAGTLWPLPELRLVWKSEEASREIYACFLREDYEILPVDRFDGSLGFLIYLLESRLGKKVFLILRGRMHGILALHLQESSSAQLAEVVLVREPLRRPRDYHAGDSITLCRVRPQRWVSRILRPAEGSRDVDLYERWRRGPLERVELDGSAELCRLVGEAAQRLEREVGLEVSGAWRNRDERLIALVGRGKGKEQEWVAFLPEWLLREQVPFRMHVVTLGDSGVPREGFPDLK